MWKLVRWRDRKRWFSSGPLQNEKAGNWWNCAKCKCLSFSASAFPCTPSLSSSLTCQLYPQDTLPSCSMWHALSHVLSLQLITAVKLLRLWPESRWLQRKAFPLVSFCWHHVWSTLTDPSTGMPSFLQPYLKDPQGLTSWACADCILMHDAVFACPDLDDATVSQHPILCDASVTCLTPDLQSPTGTDCERVWDGCGVLVQSFGFTDTDLQLLCHLLVISDKCTLSIQLDRIDFKAFGCLLLLTKNRHR